MDGCKMLLQIKLLPAYIETAMIFKPIETEGSKKTYANAYKSPDLRKKRQSVLLRFLGFFAD